jgi:hypothetical protein
MQPVVGSATLDLAASAFTFKATGGTADRSMRDRAADVVNAKDFGAVGDGVADDTAAIQAAIDHAAINGLTVVVPAGTYIVSGSAKTDTLYNGQATVSAGDACLILWGNVSLLGAGSTRTKLKCSNPSKTIAWWVEPNGVQLSGFEIEGGYTTVNSGAGHGVMSVRVAAADAVVQRVSVSDMYIHNVGSYGLGLENARPEKCSIRNIRVYYTGADGIDLKSRDGSTSILGLGNTVSDIDIRNHGCRVDGSAGIDCRGAWHMSGITVSQFGANPALTYTGLRFRGKQPVDADMNLDGEFGTLTGFLIDCSVADAAGSTTTGLFIGCDDVTVSNGTIIAAYNGIEIFGNVNGDPVGVRVIGVGIRNAGQYSAFVGSGCSHIILSGIQSSGATTAGIRNEGDNVVIDGISSDATPVSTSTAASATQVSRMQTASGAGLTHAGADVQAIGPSTDQDLRIYAKGTGGVEIRNGNGRVIRCAAPASSVNYITANASASGSAVSMAANGSDADVDFQLTPRGAGRVRFGTRTASGDVPVTGYIEIKDAGGNIRRLAVVG